jgi:hypothetical protein
MSLLDFAGINIDTGDVYLLITDDTDWFDVFK